MTLCIFDDASGRRFDVGVVGREELPKTMLSRRHFVLRIEAGKLIIEDLDSRSGTFVNEQIVHGPKSLSEGDVVRAGDVTFVVERLASTR